MALWEMKFGFESALACFVDKDQIQYAYIVVTNAIPFVKAAGHFSWNLRLCMKHTVL